VSERLAITRGAALVVVVALLTPAAVHAGGAKPRMLAPAGGETWAKGTTRTIRWQAPAAVAGVDLHLWHAIVCVTRPCEQRPSILYTIANEVPNSGRYEWSVPSLLQEIALPPSGWYFVRVRDRATGAFADSPAPFRIVGRP